MSTPLVRTAPGLCGPGPWGGLTTRRGFPAGDEEDPGRGRTRVREALAAALGRAASTFAWCSQVHGARVRWVEAPGHQGEGDALATDDPSMVLAVAVADCNPVLVWDPGGPSFACAHAGWRGLLAGVLEATVETLARRGAEPSRLRAWIGPSISVERFEVGEDVAALFPAAHIQRREEWTRPHVDLKALAAERLAAAGLPPDAVRVCGDCTHRRAELYFSYRRDRGICGRHLAYLTRA